jgi:hypothetical protein
LAALIIHVGLFTIERTQRWRLEELSFGNLLFVPAVLCAGSTRKYVVALAGGLATLTICVRPSYIFALVAFGLWAAWPPQRSWHRAGLLIAGAAAGMLCVLIALVVLSATSVFDLYRSYAAIMRELMDSSWPPWPKGDALYGTLNWLAKFFKRWHLAKKQSVAPIVAMLVLLVALIPATLRQRPSHPWWHITFAQLIAFGVASQVGNGNDYTLPAVSAALIALAYGASDVAVGRCEITCPTSV